MTEAKPENAAVNVLHRDLSTQSQLGMLLAVSTTMMQFLAAGTSSEGDRALVSEQSEAEIAAENTLQHACERIDSIIADEKRWGLEYQTRLEALFEENTRIARAVAEKQTKLIEESTEREIAQKEAALEVKSPHNLFRPSLFTMADGSWVASLGDPLDGGIFGSGVSPAAALKSFDLVFTGRGTEEQQRLIDKLKNENKSLDETRVESPGESDQGRSDTSPDSRNVEPEL